MNLYDIGLYFYSFILEIILRSKLYQKYKIETWFFYDFMKLIEECIWYDVFEITFYIFHIKCILLTFYFYKYIFIFISRKKFPYDIYFSILSFIWNNYISLINCNR